MCGACVYTYVRVEHMANRQVLMMSSVLESADVSKASTYTTTADFEPPWSIVLAMAIAVPSLWSCPYSLVKKAHQTTYISIRKLILVLY